MNPHPPARIINLQPDRIHVHVVDLASSTLQQPRLESVLNDEEQARARRFRYSRHRQRWVTCRARTRMLLSAYLDIPPNVIRFATGLNGKPLIHSEQLNHHENFHFNLSHSKNLGLLAVTRAGPVGIDVEFLKTINDWQAVATRFFSETEQQELAQVDPALRSRAFFLAWTRKEAIIKATGEGLSADLDSFSVALTPNLNAVVHSTKPPMKSKPQDWQLFHLEPQEEYVGAVAIQADTALTMVEISSDNFE